MDRACNILICAQVTDRSYEKISNYIKYIPDEAFKAAVDKGFEATAHFSRASEADALILCVPVPLDNDREPDSGFVINTVDCLLPHLKQGQMVSLESTTYHGTTDEELNSRIEGAGLKVGIDVSLVYSPEKEDQVIQI